MKNNILLLRLRANKVQGLILLIAGVASCAPRPFQATNHVYHETARKYASVITSQPKDSIFTDSARLPERWIGTVNFGMRKPNVVIIHHTAQNSCEQTLNTFTLARTEVSAHYVICRDGTVHHILNDYLRAWHAGVARWGNVTDINSISLGIELDNNGNEPFPEVQLSSLIGLLRSLKQLYAIPVQNFIGHGDVAPSRKNDPSAQFPWKRLAGEGFGLWYSDTTGVILPPDFNPSYALKIIGYDISSLPSAINAFRRHYLSTDLQGELSLPEKKLLYALLQRVLSQ